MRLLAQLRDDTCLSGGRTPIARYRGLLSVGIPRRFGPGKRMRIPRLMDQEAAQRNPQSMPEHSGAHLGQRPKSPDASVRALDRS